MKNYEKYADEIREYKGVEFCEAFIIPNILKSDNCAGMTCYKCRMLQTLWLLEDCEESEVDWSKIKVDTPILVRQGKTGDWLERHFAKYENGNVYAWVDGQTSWTGADEIKWKYAKLAESEVDWSNVNVDTPILVRHSEKAEWIRRYFAKYENGLVYAWGSGLTSWTTHGMTTAWQFAKLAEGEEE